MSRKLGVIARIFTNLRNSFGAPKQKVHFVGQDHLGNRYFQKDPDPSNNLRGGRWTETRDNDQFNPPELPVEWEAWIRGSRDEPPSQEELDQNYVTMMKTINRAKELEKRDFQKTDNEDSTETSSQGLNIGQTVTAEDRNKAKFPVYEGMEVKPGEKY